MQENMLNFSVMTYLYANPMTPVGIKRTFDKKLRPQDSLVCDYRSDAEEAP